MGDRAYYYVDIRAPEALLGPIGRLLVGRWGFEEEWLPPTWTGAPPYQDTWTQEELLVDAWDEMATDLDLLMIDLDQPFAYRIRRDPSPYADGFFYGFIPGVGYSSGVESDGTQYVSVDDLDRLLEAWQAADDPAADGLVDRIRVVTGKAWRDAWDNLDDLQEAPQLLSSESLATGDSIAIGSTARWLARYGYFPCETLGCPSYGVREDLVEQADGSLLCVTHDPTV